MADEPPHRVESDSERSDTAMAGVRPVHLSVGNVALVAVGGAVGTGLRFAFSVLLPPQHGVPVGILTVNIVGAFMLGLLLEFLADTGLDIGRSRRLRLGVGTGVLGGFTTYSALATDSVTVGLVHPALAAGYGLGTVLLGGVATLAGIMLSRRRLRPAARVRREPS